MTVVADDEDVSDQVQMDCDDMDHGTWNDESLNEESERKLIIFT